MKWKDNPFLNKLVLYCMRKPYFFNQQHKLELLFANIPRLKRIRELPSNIDYDEVNKCVVCSKKKPTKDFFRKNKAYGSCNECSLKKQTGYANGSIIIKPKTYDERHEYYKKYYEKNKKAIINRTYENLQEVKSLRIICPECDVSYTNGYLKKHLKTIHGIEYKKNETKKEKIDFKNEIISPSIDGGHNGKSGETIAPEVETCIC